MNTLGEAQEIVLASMADGPLSRRGIVESTDIPMGRVTDILRSLREAKSYRGPLIHIAGWDRLTRANESKVWVPLFGLGNLPDKRRPPKDSKYDIKRRYAQRCVTLAFTATMRAMTQVQARKYIATMRDATR